MNRLWLDKVLNEKIIKIAKSIEAGYVEHVVRLMEGKSNKFSSIEEALTNFSERLGLSNLEMDSLKKQAMVKIAQRKTPEQPEEQPDNLDVDMKKKLEDNGITDPKAISFMSKSKNRHNKDTASPFALNMENKEGLVDYFKNKKEDIANDFEKKEQNNEFTSNSTSEGNAFGSQLIRLQKYAQEFGKLLDFKKPSVEKIEELQKELGTIDIDTPFKASRFGFNFTNLNGKFPAPGEPVKVTSYEYSFLKSEIVRIINEDLKKALAEDMPFEEWIKFIQDKVQSKEVPSTLGWKLVDELEKMRKQLYGDEKTRPFFIDETFKRISQQIKEIMKWFPVSYRKQILKLLAQGKYRHLLKEASEKEHSNIFASGYKRGSFMMMDSFSPYEAIKPELTPENREKLIRKVVENKKSEYSADEFKSLLNELNIPFEMTVSVEKDKEGRSSSREYQILPLHSKVKIKVENIINPNYKPASYDKEVTGIEAKEQLLQTFNDKLFSAIDQRLPLAYAPQEDGSFKEVRLQDLGSSKADYTLSLIEQDNANISNPNAGMHPGYQGKIKQQAPKSRIMDVLKSKPEEDRVTLDLNDIDEAKSETKQEPKKDKIQEMLDRLIKSESTHLIQKYAQSDLWIDSKGKIYNSEKELRDSIFQELAASSEQEIIDTVAEQVLKEIPPMPTVSALPKEEIEEEQMAAAASTKQRMLASMSKLSSIESKIKLAKLIQRLK